MAASVRKRKPAASEVAHFIRTEAERAEETLGDSWPPPDEAVHGARKRLKKARAGLRMLRAGLHEAEFRRQNAAFRDAARSLTRIRDSKTLITTLDRLAQAKPAAFRRAMSPLRALLVARGARMRRQALGSKAKLWPLLRQLHVARRQVDSPHGSGGWDLIGPGVKRVYRDGRRAFVLVARQPTDANFHEWRKQAKYLWHALEILEPIRPRALRALAKRVHQLSDRLGDDHDLALLRHAASGSRVLSRAASLGLQAAIASRRRRLQAQAGVLGGQVYGVKPRDFEERVHGYWQAWRRR